MFSKATKKPHKIILVFKSYLEGMQNNSYVFKSYLEAMQNNSYVFKSYLEAMQNNSCVFKSYLAAMQNNSCFQKTCSLGIFSKCFCWCLLKWMEKNKTENWYIITLVYWGIVNHQRTVLLLFVCLYMKNW